MDLTQFHEQLVNRIRKYAQTSIEHRQISRRLRELLPDRFNKLKYGHRNRLHSAAKAERAALADQAYTQHIGEYVEISYQARLARIQYETHLMLLQARQSLRPFRRGKNRQ